METDSSLPPPPSVARCGCGKEYPRREVTNLKFIGRMDFTREGDERLGLFNCRCRTPGTFSIIDPTCSHCGSSALNLTQDRKRRVCCGHVET